MRSITATLLAAATSARGRPVVSVHVHDTRDHWTIHATGATSQRRTASAVVGTTIHRLRLTGQNVQHAVVATPATPAQWPGTWTTITADADPSADIALAYHATILHAFYITTTQNLTRRTSTDLGATWSAPTTLEAWPYIGYLAANDRLAAIAKPTVLTMMNIATDLGNPAWTQPTAWPNPFTNCYGVAVARHTTQTTTYAVLAALDRGLWYATYNSAACTWANVTKIMPNGDATAPASAMLTLPAATYSTAGLYVTVQDNGSAGDLAPWHNPIVLHTLTVPHFQRIALLDVNQDDPARTCLAAIGATLYAANENNVVTAPPYTIGDPTRNIAAPTPIHYHATVDETQSRLTVTIRNVGHLWSQPGLPTGQPAVRPLATVHLSRGYHTTAGDETEPLPPHYITAATVTQGMRSNDLTIEAVDARGLLDIHHPPDLARWTNRTIRWLLAHVAAQTGFAYADNGSAVFARVLTAFTQRPPDTSATALRALLELAGAIAWVDANGTLQARPLQTYAPIGPTITAAQIIHASHALALEPASSVTVASLNLWTASEPDAETMDLGLLTNYSTLDVRATDTAAATAQVAYLRLRQRMTRRSATLHIHLRPDLELYDRLTISHAPALPAGSELRRLVAMDETWHPAKSTFHTTLTVQRIPT